MHTKEDALALIHIAGLDDRDGRHLAIRGQIDRRQNPDLGAEQLRGGDQGDVVAPGHVRRHYVAAKYDKSHLAR